MKALKVVGPPVLFVLLVACGSADAASPVQESNDTLVVAPLVDYTYGNQVRRSWLTLTPDGTVRTHEQHCGGCTPTTSVDQVSPEKVTVLRQAIEKVALASRGSVRGEPATQGGYTGRLDVRSKGGAPVHVHSIDGGGADPEPGDVFNVTYAQGAAAAALRTFVNERVAVAMPPVD